MTRLLTMLVPYTFNRKGYYYFSRRVADLADHYHCSRVVVGFAPSPRPLHAHAPPLRQPSWTTTGLAFVLVRRECLDSICLRPTFLIRLTQPLPQQSIIA